MGENGIVEEAYNYLVCLGFTVSEGDKTGILTYLAQRVTDRIHNITHNFDAIPDKLNGALIDLIAAEWIYCKQATGGLTGFSFEAAVKEITEGDTRVAFATDTSKTDSERIDDLINRLRESENEFMAWRKLRWCDVYAEPESSAGDVE